MDFFSVFEGIKSFNLIMPLLDPDQQFYFCSLKEKQPKTSNLSFFLKYLPIASKHLSNSYETIRNYPKFRDYFLENISFLNHEFGLSIPSKEKLEVLKIHDYFFYFYNQLNQTDKIWEGTYFTLSSETTLYCFEPHIDFSNTHRWHFTDSSFVILTINDSLLDSANMKKAEIFINFEILILKSLGFTLVLCTYISSSSKKNHFIFDLIKKGYFAEIHMDFKRKLYDSIMELNEILSKILAIFVRKNQDLGGQKVPYIKFHGYFYLYFPYSSTISDSLKYLETLNQNPYYNHFIYSLDLSKCFKPLLVKKVRPFVYCETGFKSDVVKVNLCKIPLYDQENEEECISPSRISQLETGYVSTEDFLMWKCTRVEIIFNEETKYADFSDLHVIKPELYVQDTLQMMKKDQESLEILDEIENEASILFYKNEEKFVKQKISKFFNTDKAIIRKGLIYLSYAVRCLRNINLHRNQLYASFDACTSCLFNDKSADKGIVYQLETGEGKSVIIQIIAALLALNDKVVHISSSNIILSKRDYSDSYRFFKKLGIKSAVLLHDNELANNINDESEEFKQMMKKLHFNKIFYTNQAFDNSLKMNFSVCGLGNDGKEDKNDVKVIFSTFINFEALYLKMIENWSPSYVEKYFGERSLIVDEADSILIDDLANGTILSRSMPSNASEVLQFVYQCKMGQLKPKNFKKVVNHFTPDMPKETMKQLLEMYTDLLFDQNAENPFELDSKEYLFESSESKDGLIPTSTKKEEMNLTQEQKENAENLLNFVFLSKMGQLNPSSLKEMINILWPDKNESIYKELESIYREIKVAHKLDMKNKIIPSQLMELPIKKLMIFICQTKMGRPDLTNLLEMIKKYWPECTDITENHLQTMFKEIELVQTSEFTNGKKYSIETIKNDKKKKKNKSNSKFQKSFTKLLNFHQEIQNLLLKHVFKAEDDKIVNEGEKEEIAKKQIQQIQEEEEKEKEELRKIEEGEIEPIKKEETKNEEEEEEEDFYERKEIFPFDYDNKGILERNKEFGGFIQQFIAIKEKLNDPKKKKNMKIKDVALNYLYVSHPIFVKLYRKVCGFTGTIGSQNDKDLFKQQYGLVTDKIPRNKPNRRIQLPIILCKNLTERNQKILEEVFSFNVLNIPVLVVLRDLREIGKIKALLASKRIYNVNVFDGINDKLNPEELAGLDGAVSLGTNFCGRGTDIQFKGKPLHVIVSYYSRNERVMQQVYGRTARQGKEGTCRVICLEKEFTQPFDFLNNNEMKMFLNEFELKKQLQLEFIEKYRTRYEWIFQHNLKNIKIDIDYAQRLKESRINVNRIRACNYKYPICMSIDTFLSIQSQKIFSLYNCPNSKYTWRLFQRYIREMILESWSLLIDEVERNYFILKDERICNLYTYEDYLRIKIRDLNEKLEEFLPNNKEVDILSTFMNIHEKVADIWQPKIDEVFNSAFLIKKRSFFSRSFISINFGFMPFSLLNDSGSKIDSFEYDPKINYIKDPEIFYLKLQEDGKTKLAASITEKIDGLFDTICNVINKTIGGFTGLRFFIKRTLAGCEFGACVDFNLTDKDYSIFGENCLIDKDPLFLFTIQVKSFYPLLAGMLIIVLVFASKICSMVTFSVEAIIQKFVKMGVKLAIYSAIRFLAKKGLEMEINNLFRILINCLIAKLEVQVENLRTFDEEAANTFADISSILVRNKFTQVIDGILGKFGHCFIMNGSLIGVLGTVIPNLVRIALIVLLCLVAFFMNFRHKRAIAKDNRFDVEDQAAKYDNKQDAEAALEENLPVIDAIYPV